MEDCNYLELQSMALEYKQRRMAVQQNKKMAAAIPIATYGHWSQHLSSSGRVYYYNRRTEVSQWHQPHDWQPISADPFREKSREQPEGQNIELAINSEANSNDIDSSTYQCVQSFEHYSKRTSENSLPPNDSPELGTNDELRIPSNSCRANERNMNRPQHSKHLKPLSMRSDSSIFLSQNSLEFASKNGEMSGHVSSKLMKETNTCSIVSEEYPRKCNNGDHVFNTSQLRKQSLKGSAHPNDQTFNDETSEMKSRYHKQQLIGSKESITLPLSYTSEPDTYTVVVNLFTSITTLFEVFATLEEGPPFEKTSSHMLDLLMRLTDLVPTLEQSQYNAIFKDYLNLVEKAIQVIMEKLLPAECLDDHEDKLQSLLTRLIAVINENKYNDEEEDADDIFTAAGAAENDDDDDGEIVSDDDMDNSEFSDINKVNSKDGVSSDSFINQRLNLDSFNKSACNIKLSTVNLIGANLPSNGCNSIDSLLYSVNPKKRTHSDMDGVFICEKRQSMNIRNDDNVEYAYHESCTIADPENLAYVPPISILCDFIESTANGSVREEDEGLCDTADDEDADDVDSQLASQRLSDIVEKEGNSINANSTTLMAPKSSTDHLPPLNLVHNQFDVLSDLKHLFDVRLTDHINSWRTFEREADQRARECNHFMNVPYRIAISALKQARSNLRVEDTIYQLQLHRKQHLELQIKNLDNKTL